MLFRRGTAVETAFVALVAIMLFVFPGVYRFRCIAINNRRRGPGKDEKILVDLRQDDNFAVVAVVVYY